MHEFFAGSGLVAYGLQGMFYPVWANDNSPKKAAVYKNNFPEHNFVLDNIENISGKNLPFAHLSWASFPCQDLSLAGLMGGIDSKRSGLVWEWIRILDEMPIKPLILLVENVIGLLSSKEGENYIKLHNALLSRGYKCGAIVINASHFVPQSRPRVFVIAIQENIIIPNELIDDGPNWLHNKAATALGQNLPNWVWWSAEKPQKRKVRLNDLIDFSIPYDKNKVLSLMSDKSKNELEKHANVIATGYRRTRQGNQTLELRFDGLAGCLRTPDGGSSKQFLIVKRDGQTRARFLTSREAARLMGAPDSFILPPRPNDGYKAMGDAVALPVASYIGKSFLLKLAEVAYIEQYI